MSKGGNGADGSRRQELICAAARLMRKKGYAATTIRDIARAVGMGSGSPFCHFRRKEEILAAIAREGLERTLAHAERLRAERMHAPERLQALLRLHAQALHGQYGDYSAVLLREWHALTPDSRRRLATLVERYESIWCEALQTVFAAKPLAEETRVAARLLLGGLNWSIYWFRGGGRLEPIELADMMAALIGILPRLTGERPETGEEVVSQGGTMRLNVDR